MHSIMEGLSASSKPPKPEPQVLDLEQLLVGIRELVADEARRANVAVRLALEGGGLTARGDRSHAARPAYPHRRSHVGTQQRCERLN